MVCSPPAVHGILQARILEWTAISFSGDPPNPGIEPKSLTFPALAGRFLTPSNTWGAHQYPLPLSKCYQISTSPLTERQHNLNTGRDSRTLLLVPVPVPTWGGQCVCVCVCVCLSVCLSVCLCWEREKTQSWQPMGDPGATVRLEEQRSQMVNGIIPWRAPESQVNHSWPFRSYYEENIKKQFCGLNEGMLWKV